VNLGQGGVNRSEVGVARCWGDNGRAGAGEAEARRGGVSGGEAVASVTRGQGVNLGRGGVSRYEVGALGVGEMMGALARIRRKQGEAA
jgi:hypothetical protein